MRQSFVFIIAILLLPFGVQAQRAEVLGIGLSPRFGGNSFSSDVTLPVSTPPNPYSDVSGLDYWLLGGNIYYAPFFKNPSFLKNFSFELRGAYEPFTRSFESENSTVTLIGGDLTPITFTHTVEASFKTIPLDVVIAVNVLNEFSLPDNLSFLKNISVGISPQFRFLTDARYVKSQRINDPSIDFLEGGNAKTEFDGNIAETNSVLYGLGGSVQLPIRLSQDFFFKPCVSYTQGFTDVAVGLPWKISGWRGSLGVEYAAMLAPKEFLKDTVILRDTTLQLAAFNAPDTTILLKTDFRDSTTEDENYIYTTTFKEETYTHFTPKPAPLLLADMRVRFLKGGVETETVSLFLEDSVVRRTIVTPMETRLEFDTLHFTEFPHVVFYPEVTSESGVASWKIDITQQGKLLKTFHGDGEPGSSVNWNIALEADPVRIAQQPIDYAFSVTDREGQTSEMQSGKITFELQKKVNLPNAQLPVIREEFYFSKTLSAQTALSAFKKRVLKTSGARIVAGSQEELADARTLAGMLKISDNNMTAGEIPARFKNMIAVYLYR